MSAGIYCRISRDKRGGGLGVERQEEDCRLLAQRLGWGIGRVYPDNDISAYSGKKRPGYEELLKDIREGRRDGLLIWHNDRLHRNPTELEHFITVVEEAGIPIQSCTSGEYDLTTPSGRMSARIVGATARYESEHKSERIRRERKQSAEMGKPAPNRRAFGYTNGMTATLPEEAAIIQEMADRVLRGEGLRALCRELDGRGIKTTGKSDHWYPNALKRILTSDYIAGVRVLRRKTRKGSVEQVVVAEGQWPAILSMETVRQLRAILLDPARDNRPGGRTRSLLGGVLAAGNAGRR